jgi:hypothetical protein
MITENMEMISMSELTLTTKLETKLFSFTSKETTTTSEVALIQIITFSVQTITTENSEMISMSEPTPIITKKEIFGLSKKLLMVLSLLDQRLIQIIICSLLMMEPINTVMISTLEPTLMLNIEIDGLSTDSTST